MLTLLLSLAALQDPRYETMILETGKRADATVASDMNGDGRLDLIVQSGRDLHLYVYGSGGGFTARPQHTVRLGGTAFLWTLGSLDGKPHPVILTAGARGVQGIPFDGTGFGPPVDLVVHPSLFESRPSRDRPPAAVNFAPDLDGDGKSDVLLFQKGSVFLLKQLAGGAFKCIQKLPLPVEISVGVRDIRRPWELTESASIPALAFGDTNGDGRMDLSYYRNESIGIFEQKAAGGFAVVGEKDLTTKKRKRRNRYFQQFELPPWVGDFNRDGLLDLAVVYASKGRVQIYYGRPGRTDFTQPDDIMRSADSWSAGIYTEDLDGDGRQELILGVVRKFGIAEGIDVFLSGKVDIELHFYPMQASGRFVKDPVQELKFSIPYALQVTRQNATIDLTFRPNFKGDFNGDGRKDLLAAGDARSLRIFPGVPGRMIAAEPWGTIRMNPPEGTLNTLPFVADFNGDGVSDLVLKHVLPGGKTHALELKLSR